MTCDAEANWTSRVRLMDMLVRSEPVQYDLQIELSRAAQLHYIEREVCCFVVGFPRNNASLLASTRLCLSRYGFGTHLVQIVPRGSQYGALPLLLFGNCPKDFRTCDGSRHAVGVDEQYRQVACRKQRLSTVILGISSLKRPTMSKRACRVRGD